MKHICTPTLSPFTLSIAFYKLLHRTYFTFLSFIFKCILIIQWVFALVFHKCVYQSLIRLSPVLFSLSYHPATPQQLSVHFIVLPSYTVAIYFIINQCHPLFQFCHPVVPQIDSLLQS
jgi:hypothetical protein